MNKTVSAITDGRKMGGIKPERSEVPLIYYCLKMQALTPCTMCHKGERNEQMPFFVCVSVNNFCKCLDAEIGVRDVEDTEGKPTTVLSEKKNHICTNKRKQPWRRRRGKRKGVCIHSRHTFIQ